MPSRFAGLGSLLLCYPALKRWANFCRAYGACLSRLRGRILLVPHETACDYGAILLVLTKRRAITAQELACKQEQESGKEF